mmetsp:Transcript_103486/g.178285  ORF Transcript_103486/g.178285 Transcript_103486/m.178285 type:complete len:210 (-) Transcript_103486:1097-1726(-)
MTALPDAESAKAERIRTPVHSSSSTAADGLADITDWPGSLAMMAAASVQLSSAMTNHRPPFGSPITVAVLAFCHTTSNRLSLRLRVGVPVWRCSAPATALAQKLAIRITTRSCMSTIVTSAVICCSDRWFSLAWHRRRPEPADRNISTLPALEGRYSLSSPPPLMRAARESCRAPSTSPGWTWNSLQRSEGATRVAMASPSPTHMSRRT